MKERLYIEREIRAGLGGYTGKLLYAEHHESHAASAYYPSPYDEAAILTIDGVPIGTSAEFGDALAARKPGDQARIAWRARAGEREATVTVRASPRVEVVLFEDAGLTPSAGQLAFREAWLRSAQR